jgi:hypothetical protein
MMHGQKNKKKKKHPTTLAVEMLFLGVLLVPNFLKCNDSLTLINCLHTGSEVTRCEDDVGIIYQG